MPGRSSLSHKQARAERARIASAKAKTHPLAIANARKTTGRPRKTGDRYDNGRLKELAEPNQIIVDRRRALLGKPEAFGAALRNAESPLSLMWSRGWLSTNLYTAANAYAEIYRKAYAGLGSIRCVDPGAAGGGGGAANDTLDGNAAATCQLLAHLGDIASIAKLRELALDEPTTTLLLDVCVLHRWPEWLIGKALVQDLAPRLVIEERKFTLALKRLDSWLNSPRQQAA